MTSYGAYRKESGKDPSGQAYVDVICPECGNCGRLEPDLLWSLRASFAEFKTHTTVAVKGLIDSHEAEFHRRAGA